MTPFDEQHDDNWKPHADSSPAGERPAGDVDRPARVAREVGRALWGRDLLGPRPGWWPWGAKARARAQRRRVLREVGAQRRAELHHRFTHDYDGGLGDVLMPWRPVPVRRNIVAVAGVITLVAAVVGLAWSMDEPGTSDRAPGESDEPRPIPTRVVSGSATATTAQPSSTATSVPSLPAQPPIPPAGVAPTAVSPRPATDPATIVVVAAPQMPPAGHELASPELAARAWLARWCPFTTAERLGDAEARARPAMTPDAWSLFDPAVDHRAARSWEQATAAGESGACSEAVAHVVPSAPRTPDRVVVRVTADRVVTTAAGTRYVESVYSTRVMLRQADGTWRVDLATVGG